MLWLWENCESHMAIFRKQFKKKEEEKKQKNI